MKLISDSYRIGAALLLGICSLWSCQKGDMASDAVEVGVRIGADNVIDTRAFGNDDPLSVDRILVVPFTKSDALAEDNANYKAARELAIQIDVDQFPIDNLKMLLSPLSTCRLVFIGFNRHDYDLYGSDPLANGIVIDYGNSLSDLSIEDRTTQSGTLSNAELFFDISDPFRPNGNTTVSALLTRMVGGISVTLTNVPEGVETRIYHTTPLTTRWMVIGETAADTFDTQDAYYTMTSNGNGVNYYSRYYFPTGTTTPITMEMEAVGTSSQPSDPPIGRVSVATSSGNRFALEADQAINLRGDYRQVILGLELFAANPSNNGINIDDNDWDGVDDTPDKNPDGSEDPGVIT